MSRPLPSTDPDPRASAAGNPVLRWAANWLWLLAPLVAHGAFSWIGFSPTDDGWLPAVARRLAEGEVPHRDFIFVRPALSAVLQLPLFWWGGDHVIILSRLWGWIVLGAICWLWSGRIAAGATPVTRHALYLSALALSAHTFPVMAWHSVDGMLFATLAVGAARRDTVNGRRLAFALVGVAALCRQNFGLFAPWLLLAVGGPPARWISAAAWSLLAPALYLAVMGALGAGADFVHQVAATGGGLLFHVGVVRFATEPWFFAAAAVGLGLGLAHRRTTAVWLRWPVFLLGTGALALALSRGPGWYATASFALLGLVLGLGLARIGDLSRSDRLNLVAAVGLAWTTAISFGYNNPALASGVLLLMLWQLLHLAPVGATAGSVPRILLPLAAALIITALVLARHRFPYMDRPASELTHDAGSVLRGATGLRTNPATHATLADLRALTGRLEREGRPYVILTDCAAAWIRSAGRNPLPCEWPQETELGFDPALFHRVFRALQHLPPEARIIVQRYLIADQPWRFAPVPSEAPYYFVQNWVTKNCAPAGETTYFTLHCPPIPPSPKKP